MAPIVDLPPGLMIAAPRSGAGKTTVTLGLLRALRRRGLAVQPLKCGPDYIDPAFHAAASGRTSFNIDSWAMRWPVAAALLHSAADKADLVVVEALMGLFDGVERCGHWGTGASADLAAKTGWPVVLVLDVSGHSQSAAAAARGFRDYRDGVAIAGCILNRAGSDRHVRLASHALQDAGFTVLGALPRSSDVILPERHLGLVQAEETTGLEQRLDALADFIDRHVDIGAVVALARPGRLEAPPPVAIRPPGQKIALARDAAFSFVYPHLLEGWRAAGAAIAPFSPLNDEPPAADADVAWLPGGYPELYAGRLAAAGRFMSGVREFATTRPVHGECGGYMALGAGLIDANGARHEMAGLLGLETSFAARKMNLGYRRAALLAASPIGPKGGAVTGHEFHYATILSEPDAPLLRATNADGEAQASGGSINGRVSGSFFHLIDESFERTP
ncbi:MAG: cobyrinate a,c-diamide synthase [Hyphomicrobium sp.]